MSNPAWQRNFNGTTLTLGGASQGKITSVALKQGGEKIPVYEPGDLLKLFELGIPDASVSIGLAGVTGPTLGAVGALAIVLGNGNSLAVPGTTWQCMSVSRSGRSDANWTGDAEYAPTTDTNSTA